MVDPDRGRQVNWDGYARLTPHSGLFNEPIQAERAGVIARRVKGTILDVGGGEGVVGEHYPSAPHIIDISSTRVERARERGHVASVGDARRLPFDDNSFDTVVLGEVLEHIGDPGPAFAEAFRVARERVVVSLPLNGWEDISHKWRISLDLIDDEEQHNREPTKGQMIVLTFQAGECWPPGYAAKDPTWAEQFDKETA